MNKNPTLSILLIFVSVLVITAAVVAVVVTGPIRWIALGVALLAAVAAGAALFALRKGSQHL